MSVLVAARSMAARSASSSPVVVAAVSILAAPVGGLDPPGVGGAEDGNGHDVGTFRRPRRRVRSNSLSSRSAVSIDRSAS